MGKALKKLIEMGLLAVWVAALVITPVLEKYYFYFV